jgi:anti-anti-sigma regulatory factor
MAKQIEIVCPEVMDITVVGEFHSRFREQLIDGSHLCLDAGTVQRTDTAFLQMLAALFLDAATRGITIAWKAPSEKLIEAAQLLDLQDTLRLAPDT